MIMKNLIILAGLVMVLVAGCGRSGEQEAWDWFYSRNRSIETGESYLYSYAQGPHASQVRQMLDDLYYIRLGSQRTIDGCETYLAKFPQGRHAQRIQNMLQELCLDMARMSGDPAVYEKFLKRFPNRPEVASTQAVIEELCFKACKTPEDYGKFLAKYGQGVWAKQAADRKARLELLAALALDTIESLEEFLKRTPEGRFADKARDRIIRIRKQQADKTYDVRKITVVNKSCTGNAEYDVPVFEEVRRIFEPIGRQVLKGGEKSDGLIEVACDCQALGGDYQADGTRYTGAAVSVEFSLSLPIINRVITRTFYNNRQPPMQVMIAFNSMKEPADAPANEVFNECHFGQDFAVIVDELWGLDPYYLAWRSFNGFDSFGESDWWLAGLPNERVKAALKEIVQEDAGAISECASEALGVRLAENNSFPPEFLNSSDKLMRRSALSAAATKLLGFYAQSEDEASQVAIEFLKDAEPAFRARAAYILGEGRQFAAVDALIAALKDSDETVRAAAATALRTIGDPKGLEALPEDQRD